MDFNYKTFQTIFPDHVYRYIDTTGLSRTPIAYNLPDRNKELNTQKGYDSFFTVNGFATFRDTLKSCTIENITSLNALYTDLDSVDKEDPNTLKTIKDILKPTLIVETMRGYHIYWCFDQPIYQDEHSDTVWEEYKQRYQALLNKVVEITGGDKNAKDIARILRVPNSLYWKKTGDAYLQGPSASPHTTKVLEYNPAATYTIETFEDVLKQVKTTQTEKDTIKKITGNISQNIITAAQKT